MNKTKIIVGIVIIAVAAGSLYYTTYRTAEGNVTTMLIIENGERKVCEVSLAAGSTVFDLMTACDIPFEEDGGFVTSINGVSQDASAGLYWVYYVNGEFAQVGAADYIIQEGDEITWKLESF